jgi:hypothetical protein
MIFALALLHSLLHPLYFLTPRKNWKGFSDVSSVSRNRSRRASSVVEYSSRASGLLSDEKLDDFVLPNSRAFSKMFDIHVAFEAADERNVGRSRGGISSHLSRPGGENRWLSAIVPDTRYVGRRALCTFGRVFASSFDLRGWKAREDGNGERGPVFRRKWPKKEGK